MASKGNLKRVHSQDKKYIILKQNYLICLFIKIWLLLCHQRLSDNKSELTASGWFFKTSPPSTIHLNNPQHIHFLILTSEWRETD